MAEGEHGIVAAGHPLTAEAGARVLREGGNAVDAALAAMLTSFAAEPLLTGLGAGGYMLVAGEGAEPKLLDFFVQAPGDPRERGSARAVAELDAVDVSFGDAAQVFYIGPASCGVYGVPAADITVLTQLETPWSSYEYLTRVSQIPRGERLRSDSKSTPDNIWGFPSYAVREAFGAKSVKGFFSPLWNVMTEPILADYYTPKAGQAFETMEAEFNRIGYAQCVRKGQVRMIRRRRDLTDRRRVIVTLTEAGRKLERPLDDCALAGAAGVARASTAMNRMNFRYMSMSPRCAKAAAPLSAAARLSSRASD